MLKVRGAQGTIGLVDRSQPLLQEMPCSGLFALTADDGGRRFRPQPSYAQVGCQCRVTNTKAMGFRVACDQVRRLESAKHRVGGVTLQRRVRRGQLREATLGAVDGTEHGELLSRAGIGFEHTLEMQARLPQRFIASTNLRTPRRR